MLIDTRTGFTELSGLATTVLADTVVCMCVANEESIEGTLAVVAALKAAPRLASQGPLRIVPVVSRATGQFGDYQFGGRMSAVRKLGEKLFVLPHDNELETSGLYPWTAEGPALHMAYLELFQSLFPTTSEDV